MSTVHNVVYFFDDKKVIYILPNFLHVPIQNENKTFEWKSLSDLSVGKHTAQAFDGSLLNIEITEHTRLAIPWDDKSEPFICGNLLLKR